MRIKQMQLSVWLALLGAVGVALADPKADSPATVAVLETIVVVRGPEAALNCNEATPARARWLAEKASQDGAYQRAGECYLIAGEQAMADQAFIKASAQTSEDTSRKLAANLNDVKAQARQMKEAFRHR
jgi:hypothetical protein